MTTPTIEQVRTIAVLGAGTMGAGIAHVAALAGYRVELFDIDADIVDRGRQRIETNLAKGVKLGKVEASARDASLERIFGHTDIATTVAEADVVIEAAPEKLDLKQKIFREVDAAATSSAVFATNTSSLSISDIAAAVKDPARVVGMHFFNPVHIMKLVEVVHHSDTAPAVVAVARALAENMGKTAITVKDAPGFASSRLGLVIGLEAMRMVEAGVASAADIDTAMKLGYGHPMGPLELTDLVGLDVRLSIAEYLTEHIGPTFEPPAVLVDKVAAGHLGKKSGQGFYEWRDGKRADR